MRVLVCGDRNWTNYYIIHNRLKQFPPGTVVIEGEARGADRLAGQAAEALGLEVHKYPAEWDKYGKAAGPRRNCQMLDEKPDIVLAFHNNIKESRGTKHCVTEAINRGIPVKIIVEKGVDNH